MQPRLLRSPARLAGTSLLRVQSDDRLVALAREGHERAFEAIVERYRVALERYATRLVGPTRGEDAVQQAFVNAHSYLIGHPEKAIELKPWLYRIVHNAALNTLRASRDEQSLDELTDRAPLGDDVIERRERLREALDAVAALPANQRDAILLRELEGRSHDEIALALGVSAGAARQQIFRARAALRAAATAITPQPLLVKCLEMATTSASSGSADLAAGAGAGLTAVLAKAGAGVLVTGAVVGSAVGTGVVHTPVTHSQDRPAREVASHVSRADRAAAAADAKASSAVARSSSTSAGSKAGHRRSAGGSSHANSGEHRRGRDRGSEHASSNTVSTHRRPVVTGHRPTHTAATEQETHHSGTTEHSGHHGSKHGGSGSSGSGKHGSHDGVSEAAEAPEVESPEAETGGGGGGGSKGGSGGGGATGGKGGGEATTTTPTAPTTTTPTVTQPATTTPQAPVNGGGGGGGGGATSGGGGGNTQTTVAPPANGGSGK